MRGGTGLSVSVGPRRHVGVDVIHIGSALGDFVPVSRSTFSLWILLLRSSPVLCRHLVLQLCFSRISLAAAWERPTWLGRASTPMRPPWTATSSRSGSALPVAPLLSLLWWLCRQGGHRPRVRR